MYLRFLETKRMGRMGMGRSQATKLTKLTPKMEIMKPMEQPQATKPTKLTPKMEPMRQFLEMKQTKLTPKMKQMEPMEQPQTTKQKLQTNNVLHRQSLIMPHNWIRSKREKSFWRFPKKYAKCLQSSLPESKSQCTGKYSI